MRTSGGAPAVSSRSVPLVAHSSSSQGSMSSMTRTAPSGGIREPPHRRPRRTEPPANSANASPATFSHAPTRSPPCSTVTAAHGPKGRSGATPAATSGIPLAQAHRRPRARRGPPCRAAGPGPSPPRRNPTSSGQVRPSIEGVAGKGRLARFVAPQHAETGLLQGGRRLLDGPVVGADDEDTRGPPAEPSSTDDRCPPGRPAAPPASDSAHPRSPTGASVKRPGHFSATADQRHPNNPGSAGGSGSDQAVGARVSGI